MRRFGSLSFAIAVATIMVFSVSAQNSLSLWPYYAEVMTGKTDPGLYDLIVPLPVLDMARPDLADLRLFDGSDREIPYAIRVRREVAQKREIPARLFNYGFAGPTTSEVWMDLGENPGEHNEVDIDTTGANFRRTVVVEGSDSGQEWRTLTNDGVIYSFTSQNTVADLKKVTYPNSRYRYLRVRVSRDQMTDKAAPQISGVKVLMSVHEKGQLSTWNVPVPSYQLLRNQGAHASAWNLDLGGSASCDRLTLQIGDESFSRPFLIESLDDPQNIRLLASGELTRRAGDQQEPLTIFFDEEVVVRKLRLQITDYSNPTLNIDSISASAPARQLIFELKGPAAAPLRLYFGNAKVTAPHYDFEKELPARLKNEPVRGQLDSLVGNPQYKPEPLPLTERIPWLIYFVLAASSVALGYILLSLARAATQLDQKETQESQH